MVMMTALMVVGDCGGVLLLVVVHGGCSWFPVVAWLGFYR